MLMPHTQGKQSGYLLKVARRFAVFGIWLTIFYTAAVAQTAQTLSQVEKVYVESFGNDNVAIELRNRTIEQLQRKGSLEIVKSSRDADAIVRGSGSTWITGYLSTDPRSPSIMRHPIFQGFLSVELIGKNNEPLWSYLETPGKFRAGDITKDLANHLVDKFVGAREEEEAEQPTGTAKETGKVVLAAAGATFPAPLYQKWFDSFHEHHPSITITYSPVGSEAGLQELIGGKIDFAASDVRMSDEKMAQASENFLNFATVIGAVVPVYNLEGIGRNLNFSPDVLAGIYLGKIRKWNDPAIRELNHGAALPDGDIVVIHRSDGSGTTFAWTDYLSKVSAEWKATVGRGTSVNWPLGTGAEGNEAVAGKIQQTANSIGYVELADALQHELSFGAVRNSAGKFIHADLASVTAAATEAAGTTGSDTQVSITEAPGKNAYPITTFTWWVVPKDITGQKRTALEELEEWMLSSGQKECSALAYAPLPREIADRERDLLGKLK